jgi:hypothetical protein
LVGAGIWAAASYAPLLGQQSLNQQGSNQSNSNGDSSNQSPKNQPPTNQVDSNDGAEENVNLYNEDDSYEEPTGHYEQQCNQVLKTRPRTYDEMVAGYTPPAEWVSECRDVWVED